jgi:HemY protein
MVRLFVFSLLAIVVALWVSLYLGFPSDPGYLLIAFGDTTFETSLFALLVAVAVLYLLLRLAMLLFRLVNPLRWFRAGKRLANRRRSGQRSRTVEGLLYLTRRNWKLAHQTLMRANRDADSSVVNYLGAALAAFEMGEREAWVHCLNKAEQEYPSAHSTIHTLKAQLLYRSGQLEQCLAVLEMLRRTALNDEPLLRLLKEVYLELEEWQKLEEILPALFNQGIISAEQREQIEKRILSQQLRDLAGRDEGEDEAALLKKLHKRWKKASSQQKADAAVVSEYAQLLFELGAREEAAKLIEQALNNHWSKQLVNRYGELDFGHASSQLLVAEHWIKSRPADADLLLCAARLAMRNQLWGKAREYYRASIKIAASATAYGELARLLRALGQEKEAEQCLEAYQVMHADESPILPLPEPAIGEALPPGKSA